MKKLAMLLMAAITITSVSAQGKPAADVKQTAEKTSYVCPMHTDVTSDKPGKCSKCGMNLKAVVKTTATYVCPMHADVTSDKPGKCAKCGMALKPVEKAAAAYVCPMHSDVTSDKPGKCSKCGMNLVKK